MGFPRGVKEQRAYEYGKKLTLKQAVLAKCAECMGNYVDGKEDCDILECSLYPFMVYGKAWKGREKKTIPLQLRNKLLSGLKRARIDVITT